MSQCQVLSTGSKMEEALDEVMIQFCDFSIFVIFSVSILKVGKVLLTSQGSSVRSKKMMRNLMLSNLIWVSLSWGLC